jgi:DNA polymerase elongation subunit (family B)
MNFEMTQDHKNLLVIDIETASAFKDYSDMDERMQSLWQKKASFLANNDNKTAEELYFDRGAIYAEFGKIICISAGIFTHQDGLYGLRIKSFASDNELEVLQAFKELVESKFDQNKLHMVAHNGREYDYPYIGRRMLVNNVQIPKALDMRGMKPWEIQHIDTMELWKFGDRKNFTSLDLLAALFEVESSKNDIDGSMVNSVYYHDNDLERISAYCQRDVMVTAQVFLKLEGLPVIETDRIEYL